MSVINIPNIVTSREGLLNVLDFGVDNTGNQDISTIVNELTKEHALYFPPGVYKVENPCHIKNPIIGAVPSQNVNIFPMSDGKYTYKSESITIFKNYIQHTSTNPQDVTAVLINEGDSNVIANIAIDLYQGNINSLGLGNLDLNMYVNGILDSHKSTNRTTILNVVIENVPKNACGILVDRYTTTSDTNGNIQKKSTTRCTDISNVTIYSLWGLHENQGIRVNYGTDIHLSNIVINGTQVGLLLDCPGLIFGEDLHIWCGKSAASMDEATEQNGPQLEDRLIEWFKGTAGIKTYSLDSGYSSLYLNNLYLDTVYNGIISQGDVICINNIILINDATMIRNGSYPVTDGKLIHFINENGTDFTGVQPGGKISICNGFLSGNYYHSNLFKDLTKEGYNSVKDVTVKMFAPHNGTDWNYYKYVLPMPRYGYSNTYLKMTGDFPQPAENEVYAHEVGRVLLNNGTQRITFIDGANKQGYIDVVSSNNVTLSGDSSYVTDPDDKFWYKVDGEFVVIYSNIKRLLCQTTECCVNYDYIMCEDGSPYNLVVNTYQPGYTSLK